MAKTRREELKAKKQAYVQEEITSAAADLFATNGYRSVTIDDIASSLGYTKSVVYYYFKNKNEVLWTIFDQIIQTWTHDVEDILAAKSSPVQALAEMIRKHALNVLERTSWAAIYFSEQSQLSDPQRQKVDAHRREYTRHFKDVYSQGVKEGVFRDIPPLLVIGGITGMANWTHAWYSKDGELSPEEIADHFVTILLDGCVTKKGETDR